MKSYLTVLAPIVLVLVYCTPLDEYYSHTHTGDTGSGTHRISIDLVLSIVRKSGLYIWVTDDNGDYVNSIVTYKGYGLYKDDVPAEWIAEGGALVDGITAATYFPGADQKFTYKWDLRNKEGETVTDGVYMVKFIITKHDGSVTTNDFITQIIEIGGPEDREWELENVSGYFNSGKIKWEKVK
jgi:hypothetical protein